VKHLPKHIQPRWRYLAVEIETWPDATVERDAFQRSLWYSAQNLLGDTGSADLDLSVLRFRGGEGGGVALVRTRRGSVENARAASACVDGIDGQPVGLRVRGVSGTVRACEEKYMGDAPKDPEQRHVVFDGAQRSGLVRDGRVDVRAETAFTGATTLDIE
jgi:ribonuclease P/MRP protein subunit POP5